MSSPRELTQMIIGTWLVVATHLHITYPPAVIVGMTVFTYTAFRVTE